MKTNKMKAEQPDLAVSSKIQKLIMDSCTRELQKALEVLNADIESMGEITISTHDENAIRRRAETAFSYLQNKIVTSGKWLLESSEETNFTYDVEERNIKYICATVAHVCRVNYEMAEQAVYELFRDSELSDFIVERSRDSGAADAVARYGRRCCWYAFVRLCKPRVVVETGIDKGLGSLVLTAALRRNDREGFKGYYYGTDINPSAGYLFGGPYGEYGKILYGDSLESLQRLNTPIDIFVNDSDHSEEYERREFECIAPLLSPQALVLGDNSHCSPQLLEFARESGRNFLFIPEDPKDHWYPGAGVGIAFR